MTEKVGDPISIESFLLLNQIGDGVVFVCHASYEVERAN